jgi:alkylhydroperoxidase family enzyme
VSRAAGITGEELAALRRGAPASLFNEREKAALAYAETITLSNEVDADIFESVRRQFTEEEIIELTATITWEICVAKFNRALEIE